MDGLMMIRQQQQCTATDGTHRCGLHLGHYADECTDHADDGYYWNAQREHVLAPLADALTIMVRGIADVHVENTGGDVFCVVGTLGTWTLDASEDGWSLTDADGYSVAVGAWFAPPVTDAHIAPDAGGSLTLDDETGALHAGECEAAALTFASAYFAMIGVNPNDNR